MGRTKAKRLARASRVAEQSDPPKQTPSIPELLEKTQALIIQCDYPMAHKFASRILELQPANAEAKEMLGVALLEMGELDTAKQAFLSLVAQPSPPPSAHLYLAQLCDEDPKLGLQHYQAAIDILTATNIVRALVGQVEIWMDPSYDLCYEPDADKNCERLLDLALQTDPGNTEPYSRWPTPDDAKECLEKHGLVPPIETRLSLVKLFLELELYAPALLVLHGVMSSDDEQVEAWYLEGWCHFLMAEKAKESDGLLDDMSWEELATDSRARLEKCQMLHLRDGHPDTPLLEHVMELIKQLEGLGIHAVEEADEDDEGEWEDENSADEDGDVDMS
ncbi:hypothetical protein BDZ89DRAFT_1091474 [Hymenopellis radicata]|nr:hypothetical protein BDZ89DRAFT_1091474 [Hymenopellis radicata]